MKQVACRWSHANELCRNFKGVSVIIVHVPSRMDKNLVVIVKSIKGAAENNFGQLKNDIQKLKKFIDSAGYYKESCSSLVIQTEVIRKIRERVSDMGGPQLSMKSTQQCITQYKGYNTCILHASAYMYQSMHHILHL